MKKHIFLLNTKFNKLNKTKLENLKTNLLKYIFVFDFNSTVSHINNFKLLLTLEVQYASMNVWLI